MTTSGEQNPFCEAYFGFLIVHTEMKRKTT